LWYNLDQVLRFSSQVQTFLGKNLNLNDGLSSRRQIQGYWSTSYAILPKIVSPVKET
jgi:hypothetical protein